MKIKYILLLLVAFSYGLIGCSNGDEPTTEVTSEAPDLILDKNLVFITIGLDEGNMAQVNIKDGAGDFKSFSLNKDIAEVEISDNTINIRGMKNGTTDVIVMDKNNSVQKIQVTNIYDKITIEEDLFRLEHLVGKQSEEEFFFLTGNGEYEVTVEDEDVIEAYGKENSIVIKNLVEEGKSMVKITDSQDRVVEIPVEISSTIKPYNNKELAEILAKTEMACLWNNDQVWVEKLIDMNENGNTVIGASYYGVVHLLVSFPGDKTAGEKKGAKLDYKSWSGEEKLDLTYFEIIKNDGKMLWAVYSFVDKEKAIGKNGYMILNTN